MQFSDLFALENFQHKALFEQTVYPWEVIKLLHEYLLSLSLGIHQGDISQQAYLIKPELISIGEGTVIEPGAYIKGPCVIGKNCTIRHGAYIRGDCLIGDGCVIGHTTELKNALFLNRAKAAHFAFVGDSILGNDVNLGAGVKCANLRLDHQTVRIKIENKKFETGMKKLGAIVGDRSQIGCNSVLNPGVILGKSVMIYPAQVCSGVWEDNSLIKG